MQVLKSRNDTVMDTRVGYVGRKGGSGEDLIRSGIMQPESHDSLFPYEPRDLFPIFENFTGMFVSLLPLVV